MIVIFVITSNHIFLAVVGRDLKFRQQQQLVAFLIKRTFHSHLLLLVACVSL